jgi:hypothetical protein
MWQVIVKELAHYQLQLFQIRVPVILRELGERLHLTYKLVPLNVETQCKFQLRSKFLS